MAKAVSQPLSPTLQGTPLWKHQRSALDVISKYVADFTKDRSLGAALAHLPTGTGKTGVIACASHFLPSIGCILVLCPRVALRDQLAREIDARFFTKLGLSDHVPKTVRVAKHGFPMIDVKKLPKTIFVMTIQMLYSLMTRRSAGYDLLSQHVELVVVDEGHYEPAISWRDAIRGIPAPKVIVTATPFRNDLKLFDVNADYVYSYTFHEAVEDKTIRSVSVHARHSATTPSAFVKDVLSFYDSMYGKKETAQSPRVIIRCDSDSRIRQIGQALKSAGRSCVLIHENFSDNDAQRPRERRSVPAPDKEHAIFWVHQFKLLEGIDDPRFQILAIFDELRTTRSLVQQVGRVIRNPARKARAIAHFLDHSAGRHEELWTGFLEFDKLIGSKGIQAVDFGDRILTAIQEAQPDVVYIDGRFRSRFSLGAVLPHTELVLPCSVNVFRKPKAFELRRVCTQLEQVYAEQDRTVRRFDINPQTSVFLYIAFRNSPLLRSECFIETELGVAIVCIVGGYVCAFDSSGAAISLLSDQSSSVSIDELKRLFSNNKETHLTAVSLHNSNLGPRALRSRSVTAAKIEDTLPTFDDHAFVCRTAQGYSQHGPQLVRRYIGFGRGKITDSSHGRVDLGEYLVWLSGVTKILGSNAKSTASFQRFATYADIPTDTTPMSLLLDLRDVEEQFYFDDGTGSAKASRLQMDDACADVNAGHFSMTANGRSYDGTVKFDTSLARYHLDIPGLDQDFFTEEQSLKGGLVRYLNQSQSFRVIPKSSGSFYTLGGFFAPIIKFGPSYNDDQLGLLKVLFPAPCLSTIGSEKGTACSVNGRRWDTQSLFSIVDLLGVGHGLESEFGDPDLLVCDDLGTEAADFILADALGKRVVFIHCKGKGNTGGAGKYSASGLQDVCGQATKNLRYFARYGSERPPKAKDWHANSWFGAKGVTGQINNRIRRNRVKKVSTGNEVWKHMQTIIRDPYSDLQVWIFLGRMFSKSEFTKQLTKSRPAAEAQQAAYLLFSTMNDVASVGATLRVFCAP